MKKKPQPTPAKDAKDDGIVMKRHPAPGGVVVAAADKGLIGKVFQEGHLRIRVSASFYDGGTVTEQIFLETIAMARNVNLVGEHVVGLAVRAGIVDTSCIITIDGVPHAQIICM